MSARYIRTALISAIIGGTTGFILGNVVVAMLWCGFLDSMVKR